MDDTRRRLKPRTFSDLTNLEPDPEWIWQGILGREQVTMLSGKPFGGKSTLLVGLIHPGSVGGLFRWRPPLVCCLS
jgi:hypothetical protein